MNSIQHRKIVENVCRKMFENAMLSESDKIKISKELQDKLMQIKTKEDLKEFMQDNADEIKASYKKADKKSKPFYKKIWNGLGKFIKSTAEFTVQNLPSLLFGAGILYAGHRIGWNNIFTFFTGRDDEERRRTKEIVNQMLGTSKESMKTVGDVTKKLTPKQQERVWEIRKNLPNTGSVADFNWKSFFVSFFNPDKAERIAAEVAKKSQENSDEQFMAGLGVVIEETPEKVDEFLDKYEKIADKSANKKIARKSMGYRLR